MGAVVLSSAAFLGLGKREQGGYLCLGLVVLIEILRPLLGVTWASCTVILTHHI